LTCKPETLERGGSTVAWQATVKKKGIRMDRARKGKIAIMVGPERRELTKNKEEEGRSPPLKRGKR